MQIYWIVIAVLTIASMVAILLLRKIHQERISAVVQRMHAESMTEKSQLETERAFLLQQTDSLNHQLRMQADQHKEELQQRLADQQASFESHLQQQLMLKDQTYSDALRTQQAQFQATIDKVSEQLKNATHEMLKERQKEFSETSRESIDQVLQPLRNSLTMMHETLERNTQQHSDLRGELRTSITHLLQQTMATKESADHLAHVFDHGNQAQGVWGETILDELLSSQGLSANIHYHLQSTLSHPDGSSIGGTRIRPDVVLHLDHQREVIIDAKVSMTDYVEYLNATTTEQREQHLKAHIASLRKHVEELSRKDYTAYIAPPKVRMDYVIMFVPNSGALWTVLHAQPDLWRKAMEKNVYIADEQSLCAALRIVEMTWRQIAQVRNHEEVYRIAEEMVHRVGHFVEWYNNIGEALEKAHHAYEEGQKKLSDNGQSIVQSANKLIRLGVPNSKKHPLPPPKE